MKTVCKLWALACLLVSAGGLQHSALAVPLSPKVAVSTVPAEVASGKATRLADLDAAVSIDITVVLLPKRDALRLEAEAVNDPSSPEFHHFLTLGQLETRFMPTDAERLLVEAWAKAGSLTEVHHWGTNHAVVFRGTVGQVNQLLSVKLGQYRLGDATYFSNDKVPTVASAVAPSIADIVGLNSLQRFHPATPSMHGLPALTDKPRVSPGPFLASETVHVEGNARAARTRPAALSPRILGGFAGIVPLDLWNEQAYNYDGLARFSHCCNPNSNASGTPPETTIAIIGANKPDPKDLNGFFNLLSLGATVNIIEVNGPACCDDEMTLDSEWSAATASTAGAGADAPKVLVYAAGSDSDREILDAWEQALADNQARVVSSSYSDIEPNYGGFPLVSISSFTDITSSMTAMGWTLVAAAGDSGGDGSYGSPGNVSCVRGAVLYPPSDYNVLAAGGTSLSLNTPLSYGSETAWCGNACGSNTACSASLTTQSTNGGGGGGGCSDTFPATTWNPAGCGGQHRALPDMALNASSGQLVYYSYGKCPNNQCYYGGSSIVAPELAGFFAQENSYLLTLGNICGAAHNAPCAPMGRAAGPLYAAVHAPHNPFYDITAGNTSNGLSSGYVAGPGYDQATGLGSANMMQLAWAINDYLLGPGSTLPVAVLDSPSTNTTYSGPVTVHFHIAGANRGLSGFNMSVDGTPPPDTTTKATPGSGDPFWDGPQVVGTTTGSINIPFAPGCHTVYVRAWDNLGQSNLQPAIGTVCMATSLRCQLTLGACPTGASPQSYTVSCPEVVNFTIEGSSQPPGTTYTGFELPEQQTTAVSACLQNTNQCQSFSTTADSTCPPPIIPPPTVLKNCLPCTETGRQCKQVPGGYECIGNIQ